MSADYDDAEFVYLPSSHVIIQLKENIVIDGKNNQVKYSDYNNVLRWRRGIGTIFYLRV